MKDFLKRLGKKVAKKAAKFVVIISLPIVALILIASFWLGLTENLFTQTSKSLRTLVDDEGNDLPLIKVNEDKRQLEIDEKAFEQLTKSLKDLEVKKKEVKYGGNYELIREFVKAEAATLYPDLRDLDSIKNNKPVGADEIQGVIKIKRNTLSGSTYYSNSIDGNAGDDSSVDRGSGNIMDIAKECHLYLSDNQFGYGDTEDVPITDETSKKVDSSGYVSWVLYKCGFTEFKGGQSAATFLDNPWEYEEIEAADAQPGDILVYTNINHVEIYCGKDSDGNTLVWSAGTQDEIDAKSPSASERGIENAKKILRVPMLSNTEEAIETETSNNSSAPTSLEGYLIVGDSHTVNMKENGLLGGMHVYAESGKKASEWERDINKIKTTNPKGIIVFLGANNIDTPRNTTSFLDAMRKKYPNYTINVVSLLPPGKNYTLRGYGDARKFLKDREVHNEKLKSYCASHDKFVYLDVAGCVTNDQGYLEPTDDNEHLANLTGNKRLFNAIASSVASGGTQTQNVDVSQFKLLFSDGTLTFYDGSAASNGSSNVGNNAIGINGGRLSLGQCAVIPSAIPYKSIIYIESSESGEGSYANKKFFYTSDTGNLRSPHQIDICVPNEQDLAAENSDLDGAPFGLGKNAKVYMVKENATWEEYQQNYANASGGPGMSGGVTDINAGAEYLTFLPREEFEKFFEDGASDDDKRKALQHFTLTDQNELVVANWSTRTEEVYNEQTNKTETKTELSIYKQSVKYQDIVRKYGMPLEFPLALLLVTGNSGFAQGVVNLSKDTKMTLMLMDTVQTTTEQRVETRTTKNEDTKKFSITIDNAGTSTKQDFTKKETTNEKNEITTTTTNQNNTVNFELTEVENWLLSLKNEYETLVESEDEPIEEVTKTEPKKSTFTVKGEDDETAQATLKEEIDKAKAGNAAASVTGKSSDVKVSRVATETLKVTGNVHQERVKIKKQPATVESKEERFLGLIKNKSGKYVKLFKADGSENKDAYYEKDGKIVVYPKEGGVYDSLKNGSGILFETLSGNENTVDFEDYMKYLLFKLTEKNYGISKFEFRIYDEESFDQIGGQRLGKGYYWPIGSVEVEEGEDGVIMATGKPSTTNITGQYGQILNEEEKTFKQGLEISEGPINYHNIIAVADGEVVELSDSVNYKNGYPGCTDGGGYGNYIKIKHEDETVTMYAHLHAGTITAKKGDKVKAGQVIGKMGNSGKTSDKNTSDCALYFQINDKTGKAVNPLEYVNPREPRPIAGFTTVLENARQLQIDLKENGFAYRATEYMDYKFPVDLHSSSRYLSCSSFVQEVLLRCGYTELAGGEVIYAAHGAIDTMAKKYNWQIINNISELQPGDIYLEHYYHIAVFAGKDENGTLTFYGSPEFSKAPLGEPYHSIFHGFSCAYRVTDTQLEDLDKDAETTKLDPNKTN